MTHRDKYAQSHRCTRARDRSMHARTLPCIPSNVIDDYLETGPASIGLIAEATRDRLFVHRSQVSILKIYILLSNGELSMYNPRYTLRGPDPITAQYACAVLSEIVYQFEYVTITRTSPEPASGAAID